MISWNLQPFAGDYSIGKRLEMYRDALGISLCIETGTQAGCTTRYLANLFNRVMTVEINPEYHVSAKEFLADSKNVDLFLGESDKFLDETLQSNSSLIKPILFFLDAHGFGHDCPLLRELAVIAKYRSANHGDVIVIHDFVVPDCPEIGFDSYQGGPICLDLVKSSMDLVFPKGWTVRFNDVASGGMRGCAFFVGKL
jgi:hypothetical protein